MAVATAETLKIKRKKRKRHGVKWEWESLKEIRFKKKKKKTGVKWFNHLRQRRSWFTKTCNIGQVGEEGKTSETSFRVINLRKWQMWNASLKWNVIVRRFWRIWIKRFMRVSREFTLPVRAGRATRVKNCRLRRTEIYSKRESKIATEGVKIVPTKGNHFFIENGVVLSYCLVRICRLRVFVSRGLQEIAQKPAYNVRNTMLRQLFTQISFFQSYSSKYISIKIHGV